MRTRTCSRLAVLVLGLALCNGRAAVAVAAEDAEETVAKVDVGKLNDAAKVLADAKKGNAPDSPAVQRAQAEYAKTVQEAKDALLKERLPALRKGEADLKALVDQKVAETDPKVQAASDRVNGELSRVSRLAVALAFELSDADLKALGGSLPVYLGKGVTLELVRIPTPGEFTMGKAKVKITKPFYLGKYEVTQKQWWAVTGRLTATIGAFLFPGCPTPTDFKDVSLETIKRLTDERRPIEHVSWNEWRMFAQILNERYGGAVAFRLPTEAEWEYASRAGASTKYFFGDDAAKLADYAWYGERQGTMPHPIGQKKPSPWGLYDIYGGVGEYCQDWWLPELSSEDRTDPTGPAGGKVNVIRGGSWYDSAAAASSITRHRPGLPQMNCTGIKIHYVGARVLLAPIEDQPAAAAAEADPRAPKRDAEGEGWLGATFEAAYNKPPIIVRNVTAGSPAEKAGLQVGDVVTAVDGKQPQTPADAVAAIRARKPGDELAIEIVRNGQPQRITATLGKRVAEDSSTAAPAAVSRQKESNAAPQAGRASPLSEVAQRCLPAAVVLAGPDGAPVGTGVIIHEAGYILTVNSVVPDGGSANSIPPKTSPPVPHKPGQPAAPPAPPTPPMKKYPYQVIARVPQAGAAILKITADAPLTAVPLGWSDDLMIGELVFAISNPIDLPGPAMSGIISGPIRVLPGLPCPMIQTNVVIGKGSLGGPLINSVGRLVGLIQSRHTEHSAVNVSLAVPINQVRQAIPQALSEKHFELLLGLTIDPNDAAKITAVEPGSPGEKAGLRAGDVLTRIGDFRVGDAVHYHLALASLKPGSKAPVEFRRSGQTLRTSITPESTPKQVESNTK